MLPFGEYMVSSGLLRLSSPRFQNFGYFLRAHPPLVFYFTATSIPFSYCLTSAGIKNVYGRNRSSWSAVRVDAGKHVGFCRGFVLSTAELLILRPTRHTGALLFHRVVSVSDGKLRSVSTILVFFGLDPAPPSFRHGRPPKWC